MNDPVPTPVTEAEARAEAERLYPKRPFVVKSYVQDAFIAGVEWHALFRDVASAEVDPWVDPEPWVYVVTGKRAAHPLPQTYYRYAPRTHLDYNVEQRTVGK